MNEEDRGRNMLPTGNVKFIGPVLPPGERVDDNTGENSAGVELSEYSGAEDDEFHPDTEDYGEI